MYYILKAVLKNVEQGEKQAILCPRLPWAKAILFTFYALRMCAFNAFSVKSGSKYFQIISEYHAFIL